MIKKLLWTLLAITVLLSLAFAAYQVPAINSRLAWRIEALQADIQYALSPPEQFIFVPQEINLEPAPSLTPSPSLTRTTSLPTGTPSEPGAPITPTTSASPTATAEPLPKSAKLSGVSHEFQTWNNCGPATLSMTLSFWGWQGDQTVAAEFLKPNPRDKNVMPYEIAAFVETQTNFEVFVGTGGNLDLIKRLIAAGTPVILEKGFEGPNFEGWMGHYVTLTGYDVETGLLTTQDSFLGPNIEVEETVILSFWRAFNFTYIVLYPSEMEQDIISILGDRSDEAVKSQAALEISRRETLTQFGRDRFFAWFNLGSNLVAVQDYGGAAAAFDQAFSEYAALPEYVRPWRMMWYQTGPYEAYYYTGRYADVINLATTTLEAMSDTVLEESYYWRALAKEATGDLGGAIEDLETSLEHHPQFAPSLVQLSRLRP